MKTVQQSTKAVLRVNSKNYLLVFAVCFFAQQLFAQPTISSFNPISGSVGTSVTITGTNFNAVVANNIVYFGAAKATVSVATTTSLSVTVPAGATYQPISVLNKSTKLSAYSTLPFTVTFNGGNNGFLPNSFSDKTDVVDSISSIEGRWDYDGDGKLDLSVVTYQNNNLRKLSILRNTSIDETISFDETKIDTTGKYLYGTVTADFDGDGKPDIAGINTQNNLYIYKNTSTAGNISFTKKEGISIESYLQQISVGDVDTDGKPDIVLMYYSRIDIYKNVTNGNIISFQKKGMLYFVFDNLTELNINDLDGDGKPDLSVANYGDDFNSVGGIYIYKNISTTDTISFGYVTEISGVGYADALSVGDIDGDGKPDIAVSDGYYFGGTHPFSLLKNTTSEGTISFEKVVSYPLESSGSISIADLNGDSKPDVILDNAIFKNISSAGTISLAPKMDYPFYISVVGDIDGDGKPDVIGSGSIRRNQVNSPYIKSFSPIAAGSAGTKITMSGLNFIAAKAVSFGTTPAASFIVESDTIINALTGQGSSGNVTLVTPIGIDSVAGFTYTDVPFIFAFMPNTGNTGDVIIIKGINFIGTTTVTFGGFEASSFDIVSDTLIHAIVGGGISGSIAISSSFGTGTLEGFTFTGFPVISSFFPLSGPVGSSVTITGKNFNEVAANNIVYFSAVRANVTAASSTSLTVTVPVGATYEPISVLNSSNGLSGYSVLHFVITFGNGGSSFSDSSFSAKTVFENKGNHVVICDMDIDGKADLITAHASANTVSILRNTGDSGNIDFAAELNFATKSRPERIAAGDLDGDGKSDLIVVNQDSSSLSVFRNTSTIGNISFAERIDFSTGFRPQNVAVGDINNDGKPDLIVTNYRNLSIFKNISQGATIEFAPKTDIETNYNLSIWHSYPSDITVADLDGDGKLDIIAGNYLEYFDDDDDYYYVISVFRNIGTNGTISFETQTDYEVRDEVLSIAVGDLNGDNKQDIVSAIYGGYGGDDVSIFGNRSTSGKISFLERQDYSVGAYPENAAIGDLDGDSKPDIAVSNLYGVSLLKNNSSNGIISFADSVQNNAVFAPDQVAIGDMDGDGSSDIILPSSYNSTISILRDIPLAAFSLTPKVSYTGNKISLTDQSNKATSWQWDFDEDGIFDSEVQNPQHAYTASGIYNVRLRINRDPLLEKLIPITILPNRGTPYTLADGGNFEINALDFAADNIGVSSFSRGKSTKPGKNGTHSGFNAWVIDINKPTYSSNSTAWLYSPSYNCTAHGDYTISFYAKYNIENEWDGFRVEYSTDKGITWQILGNLLQPGWYDYDNPELNRPFPQGEAYFTLTDASAYELKTFTTNIFQGNPSVAFRIIFKSDAFAEEAGLAIDDFTLTGPTNVVLPVNLIAFSGYNHSNQNILNWKTSAELNSSRYDIERSFDTRNFEKIGSVLSVNSALGSSYKYDDDISHIYTNNFYYRLKMVDKDGRYSYSPVVSISISNRNEKIILLGNVTSAYINIITPASLLQKPFQAEIFNMNGIVVYKINITNTSSIIYVDKLAAGKYYIRFIQEGKIVQTEQFVKQ
ncbi:hypothetical protein BH10BAC2_BH10BAC2_21220 [soil metagenome]